MPRFVLDCSVAMTWCFEDEASPETDAILDSLKEEQEAIVPSLWHLEVANVLLNAERHGRTNPKRVSDCVRQLEKLPITADPGTMKRVFKAIVPLARELSISRPTMQPISSSRFGKRFRWQPSTSHCSWRPGRQEW